ncbi:MAG: hypothetical protein EXR71_14255 [Myxococcales bacterium]|nr:hypothetical protein [Myxococcales bacterium]
MRRSPWSWVALSGLAAVVPVPVLDDWLSRRALRRAVQLDAPDDAPLTDGQLDVLTGDRSSLMVGCLVLGLWWPIKKLFRTILWFLTVKDVIDRVAAGAQVLASIRVARERGWLAGDEAAVRDAIDVAFGRTRWSPITRFLLGYERPAPSEHDEAEPLGRLAQALRRMAGGAVMDRVFVERALSAVAARGSG